MTMPVMQMLPWMAVSTAALLLLAVFAMLAARSLFAVAVGCAVLCACASAALAALGYDMASVAVALLGGVAPILMLGGVLLSARAVKPRKRLSPMLSIAAGACAATAMLWGALRMDPDVAIAPSRDGGLVAFAPLVFVAVVGCSALLGYGERGVIDAQPDRDA
jgi:hypothetical protein